MSKLLEVDDNNFDAEVLQSTLPVMVEFGATWCAPCKKQLPILEELMKESSGNFKVVKVDIDEATSICNTYKIRSVPTLLVFNDGKVTNSRNGVTSLSDLKKMLGVS